MQYTKLPLSHEKQADRILSRGMQGKRETMILRLQFVNPDHTIRSRLLSKPLLPPKIQQHRDRDAEHTQQNNGVTQRVA